MDKNDRLVLAPLAGYTDKAFREICISEGADITVTEMVSAEGLARDSKKTEELLERADNEKKLVVQLFAPDEDPISRCIENLMKYNPTSIDINCGCPVPKVVKNGAGCALMKEPWKITKMVKTLKEETALPISVKFRLGWDSSSINYLEFAQCALDGGATALTLHARTRAQLYTGVADRSAFKNLSKHFKDDRIMLYASGDIFSPEAALYAIDECNMDGVMFARGAIGNPFIFRETKEFISKGSYSKPTTKEKIEIALKHFDLMARYYGEALAAREMRKHMMAYLKGMEGASKAKSKLTKALTKNDYIEALSPIIEEWQGQ